MIKAKTKCPEKTDAILSILLSLKYRYNGTFQFFDKDNQAYVRTARKY